MHFIIFKCLSEDHHYMKSVSCVIFPDPWGPFLGLQKVTHSAHGAFLAYTKLSQRREKD